VLAERSAALIHEKTERWKRGEQDGVTETDNASLDLDLIKNKMNSQLPRASNSPAHSISALSIHVAPHRPPLHIAKPSLAER
jgi:hypothetical protein